MSFAEEKKIYGICRRENCSEKKTRDICRVIHQDRKHRQAEEKSRKDNGIVIFYLSSLPENGDASEFTYNDAFHSQEPEPEEALLTQESIRVLLDLIASLPGKYRRFVTTAINEDCVGIFEQSKSSKYREVQKMAHLLGVSERTIRRYVLMTTELLQELGKEYFSKKS